MITRKLILTGGRAGLNGLLARKWPARDGVITLQGTVQDVDALTRYLGYRYAAFPEGSEELKRHGAGEVQGDPEPGDAGQVPADVQQDGAGPSPEAAADGDGADGASPDGSEHGATGSGHEDSGLDGATVEQRAIREAIAALEPDNDEHWTADGLPRVDAVATVMNKPDLTRRDINQAAPDSVRPGSSG